MPRCLDDILDSWMELTASLNVPFLFRLWAGIALISAALTRRCWIESNPIYPPIFPNIWVMLNGEPGTGKDLVINLVRSILELASDGVERGQQFYCGGESMSTKGLIDELASEEAQQSYRVLNGKKIESLVTFHSLICCVPELGTFIPEYNSQQIGFLNDLYNCKPSFKDRIRGGVAKGHTVQVQNPHLSLLLGVQPDRLEDTFPEQAFQAGFFSRLFLIFSHPAPKENIHNPRLKPAPKELKDKLVNDIRNLTKLVGPFYLDEETKRAFDHFHTVESDATAIDHYRFKTYNTRRNLHLHKLTMTLAASQSSNMKINMSHFERAKQIMYQAEGEMPKSFEELVNSHGFQNTVEELTAGKHGKTISQREVERHLRRKYKAYEIPHIVKSMLTSGELRELPEADQYGLKQYKIYRELH